jgi:glycine oxidase
MKDKKHWDVIVVGGGIIGLSLAIALRKHELEVLIIERGEPGHEASCAAAGMLADCAGELPLSLLAMANASAKMYPEFVHELQDESGIDVDLREDGSLLLSSDSTKAEIEDDTRTLSSESLKELEPELKSDGCTVCYRKERSVDPRLLAKAALLAAKHRNVDIVSGAAANQLLTINGRTTGVGTNHATYSASTVVNCAGAWAGGFGPYPLRTRPVKGQMLALVGASVRHVVRSPEVYLVPRSDGRLVIGSTLENAGYDKRVDPHTIQRLHELAINLVPALRMVKVHEAWAGLRPGTQDDLPILGETTTKGYFVATGHYRDGILLAPITAKVMAQVIVGEEPDFQIDFLSPLRFAYKELASD